MNENKMMDRCENQPMAACFSWKAVLVGTLLGIGLNFLFFLFELALGLSAFPTSAAGAVEFSIGGFVGLIIISIITTFLVGWVTAYLGRTAQSPKYLGELYGFTAWSLSLVITMLLAAHVGQYISNYEYIVNKNVSAITLDTAPLKAVPAKIEKTIASPKTETEKNADMLAMTTFALFFLFFIGALSSCFGGRCAMSCKKRYLK